MLDNVGKALIKNKGHVTSNSQALSLSFDPGFSLLFLPFAKLDYFFLLFQYYCEVVLQDADVQWTYLPSLIAASCVALALNTLECTSWVRRSNFMRIIRSTC
jgi:hypothetical protein